MIKMKKNIYDLKNHKTSIMRVNIFVLLFLSVLVSCSTENKPDKKNIVYLDNVRLYNEFDLTKELQTKITESSRAQKNNLDSLELELVSKAKKLEMTKSKNVIEIRDFELKREEFIMRKQKFEQDQEQLTADYNNQIVSQINQYVKEFGKENAYDVIIGSNGDGTVMYGKEEMDITEEVLNFINQKYNPSKSTAKR
jgi:outer membrane protein